MRQALRIALLGDFDPQKHSHWATEAALFHAASWLSFDVESRWFPTEALESPDAQDRLAHFDGVWGAPAGLALPGNVWRIPICAHRIHAQCSWAAGCGHRRKQFEF